VTDWIEIKAVFDAPPEDWSPFVDAFDRFGCPGSIQSDTPPSLSAYLVDVPGAAARGEELSTELRRLGAREVQTQTVPEEDWSELWKIHFKLRRVGRRFLIRPTWESFAATAADLVIVLDPGQAFGTGDHPTTRLCLQLMEAASLQGKTVADIGCGSGILSVGACRLGASKVFASDIDPLAVEVTRANAQLNNVCFETIAGDGFAVLSEPRDVVVSNIISATLIRLSPRAARAVKPGGLWIVSGIIKDNWPDVQAAAERQGFVLERVAEEDDWVAATFRSTST
jgi:ribosomal protein L11 methyltransferase